MHFSIRKNSILLLQSMTSKRHSNAICISGSRTSSKCLKQLLCSSKTRTMLLRFVKNTIKIPASITKYGLFYYGEHRKPTQSLSGLKLFLYQKLDVWIFRKRRIHQSLLKLIYSLCHKERKQTCDRDNKSRHYEFSSAICSSSLRKGLRLCTSGAPISLAHKQLTLEVNYQV